MNVERRSPNMLGSWGEKNRLKQVAVGKGRRGKKREGGSLEKILAFRIRTSGYQSLKKTVFFQNGSALQHSTLQVAVVSPVSGNVHNPRFMRLMILLPSRLTACFALVTFSTGLFVPALVLSLSSFPRGYSHHLFSFPKIYARVLCQSSSF